MKLEIIGYTTTFAAGAVCGYWSLRKYIDSSMKRIELLHAKMDALVRAVGKKL
jgi:hypothetical protein